MGGWLEKLAIEGLTAIVGHGEINDFLINRIVDQGRTRPHPWSTRYPYICWTGLTDRSFNARLLPADPYPAAEALGTRRPPLEDVADLFKPAQDEQRLCPKSTCLFPAFAQYLTDGFIRTQLSNNEALEDRKKTTSNHEIDLSPLYGRTEAQTNVLRLMRNEDGLRGRLRSRQLAKGEFPLALYGADGTPDPTFCDQAGRLILDEPLGLSNSPNKASLFALGGDRANATPQTAMMGVLLLREHNRLAGKLERANPTWDDERIFQTARNILIVMYIKVVVEDYINHINTSVFKLRADPRVAWHAPWNKPNWMTVEFSLLYRWHSLIPQSFNWSGETIAGDSLLLDNSRLIEAGLGEAFVTTSANRATMLGLGNSADFVQIFEKRALDQARSNAVAGYNDYRRAMNLAPATSFAELVGRSTDTKEQARRDRLAKELERLYGDIDNLEFYVGLFAEPREKNGPLPELLMAMVAMDAFSQALTNPLLSEHIWGDPANRRLAFTDFGIAEIEATTRLRDMLLRNATGVGDRFVGMTRPGWRPE